MHKSRPFYGDLVKFMTSGPVVVSVLEGENAVRAHRDLLGPTNSNDAPAGTIRGDFGTDIERNAAHGSDAVATAKIEISYFFGAAEILAPVEALYSTRFLVTAITRVPFRARARDSPRETIT